MLDDAAGLDELRVPGSTANSLLDGPGNAELLPLVGFVGIRHMRPMELLTSASRRSGSLGEQYGGARDLRSETRAQPA